MKTRKKLSEFMKNMLLLGISVVLFLIPTFINFNNYFPIDFLFYFSSILVFLVALIFAHIELDEALNFKYKIILKNGKYHAKVLRCWFWFIIFWQPVETKGSGGSYKNVLGGKSHYYTTWANTYKTEGEARNAIDYYKKHAKEQRQEYFEREKITIQKINY